MPAVPTLRWSPRAAEAPAPQPLLAEIVFDATSDTPFACPLTLLDGDFSGEYWQTDAATDAGYSQGWHYRTRSGLAFASCHLHDDADDPATVERAAHSAYAGLFALQQQLGLAYPQRIWHWLSAVTAGNGDDQRYQRFCRGRAQALDANPHPWPGLPPATLVEGARPGLRMHALLGDHPVTPVENPRQISAYRYPRDYGVRAPAFARGGVAELGDTRYLLISGTASILGHASRHVGDVVAQADEALNNIAAVIDAAAPVAGQHTSAELECIKAYLRHPTDAGAVRGRLHARLPGTSAALLHAPLCRDDLLVEFEAQMRIG